MRFELKHDNLVLIPDTQDEKIEIFELAENLNERPDNPILNVMVTTDNGVLFTHHFDL